MLFSQEEQHSPTSHQALQDDSSTAEGPENSDAIVVNGNDTSNTEADETEMSVAAAVNGVHDDESETSMELVIPKPQLNRSNKCKLT